MEKCKKCNSVLIVDDEPEILSLLEEFLREDEGYTVYTAIHGKDALENILPHHRIDLILSDINMPYMKGFELLNQVRELYPETKRVLITAYNVEDYFELALKYDVGNIFVKTTPFNFEELAMILNTLGISAIKPSESLAASLYAFWAVSSIVMAFSNVSARFLPVGIWISVW